MKREDDSEDEVVAAKDNEVKSDLFIVKEEIKSRVEAEPVEDIVVEEYVVESKGRQATSKAPSLIALPHSRSKTQASFSNSNRKLETTAENISTVEFMKNSHKSIESDGDRFSKYLNECTKASKDFDINMKQIANSKETRKAKKITSTKDKSSKAEFEYEW
eukprot:TRINITY_DN5330_c0_g3_i2.p2 TRINITY_DN5330_c0_g3~~TRINITY_DN5330_c0_g3_i2.p2  ORF type:complete len:161 (-),score=46.65 TRINITY_DN5330_c0_g3_i2:34-516(-)